MLKGIAYFRLILLYIKKNVGVLSGCEVVRGMLSNLVDMQLSFE